MSTTPGPWEVMEMIPPAVNGEERVTFAILKDLRIIARVADQSPLRSDAMQFSTLLVNVETVEADACLIAAAPEMASALRWCVDALLKRNPDIVLHPQWSSANALLARVEG